MIYTVTCNPAVDYLMYFEDLSIGAIQRSVREAYYFSGKGINVSKVLKTLGHDSVALGFLAGFTGAAIADDLTAWGIAQDFCMLKEGNTRINVKIRHGKETDLNAQGPIIPDRAIAALHAKLGTLRDGDVLILSGSIPKSMAKTAYAEMLRTVKGKNVPVFVDADGELLRNALPERPFFIKPNREELEALLGRAMQSDGELLAGARELQGLGARNLLISLGGDGAMLCLENGEAYRIGAAKGTCISSSGAGDSLLAGFVAQWTQTGDVLSALRNGSAAGAATAFSEGLATKDDVLRILETLPYPERIGM